jgi:hypothetical protein
MQITPPDVYECMPPLFACSAIIVLLAGGTGGGTMSHKGRVHKLGGGGQLVKRGGVAT